MLQRAMPCFAASIWLLLASGLPAPAQARGGPMEHACERYCDPILDWAERKSRGAYDVLTGRRRQIDPIPVKGKGPDCGTTPDGEQKCCPSGERMRIEFRGWRDPYRNRKKEFATVCVTE
jgi:hypothetical protein